MMSEIPFLFFSCLTLWVFLQINEETERKIQLLYFGFFIVLLASSFYIRTAGLSLVAGICLFLLLERNWKLLGGTTLALVQGLMFLALAPFVGVPLTIASAVWVVIIMALLSFALTGLGFVIAWPMNSTQGFHAIMNLFLIPLWFLSGAVFPATGAPVWLGWVMQLNPLSYGVAAIRNGLYGRTDFVGAIVTAGFAVVMLALSLIVAQRTTAGDLQ